MEKRKEVLAIWPTGKDVDLEEAVAYQKALPDSKRFHKVLQRAHEEGRMMLFPRQGTPLVDDEIALIRSLNELGIYLIPFTTDSYTRNLQLDKVERGLQESIRTGKPALNGYPIINHGVKTNRRVVEATRRGPRPALVAHRAGAGGRDRLRLGHDRHAQQLLRLDRGLRQEGHRRGVHRDGPVLGPAHRLLRRPRRDHHHRLPRLAAQLRHPHERQHGHADHRGADLGRAGREERLPAGQHAGLPAPGPGRHAGAAQAACATIWTSSGTAT